MRKPLPVYVVREEHDGRLVWVSSIMDELRRRQCLCLNCAAMGTCHAASLLLAMAKEYDLAFAVTRCPGLEPESSGVVAGADQEPEEAGDAAHHG